MKKLYIVLILALSFGSVFGQNVIPGGKETIKIKGFISATAFAQDQSFTFGNGQNAEWVKSEYKEGKWIKGFDIRNTRITLVFNGPKIVKNWKMGGALEFDFFGGYNGEITFSAQQQMPRLRLAYMDFVHNNIRVRLGQAWTPMFGNVPVSLSHVAFPLGYGSAGCIGWRFPGIYTYMGLNNSDAALHLRLDAALFANSWDANSTVLESAGNLGYPQVEVKFNVIANNWSMYLVGHFDRKEFSSLEEKGSDGLDGLATEFGVKLKYGKFLVQGNSYLGKNIGQQFGAITQRQKIAKDLSSIGGWLQVGYMFNDNWSVYAFYGMENVDKEQANILFADARTEHYLMNGMVKYTTGPMSLGVEYLNSKLVSGIEDDVKSGNQISFSGMYKF